MSMVPRMPGDTFRWLGRALDRSIWVYCLSLPLYTSYNQAMSNPMCVLLGRASQQGEPGIALVAVTPQWINVSLTGRLIEALLPEGEHALFSPNSQETGWRLHCPEQHVLLSPTTRMKPPEVGMKEMEKKV